MQHPDLDPLRDAVHAAANAFFQLCVKAGDQSITGLALCPDNDVTSFYWMASTREATEKEAAEWLSEVSESDPTLGYDMDTALGLFRYNVPDWYFSEETFDNPADISAASNMLDEIWKQVDADDEAYETTVDAIRTALGDGLGRFNEGYDNEVPRDEFILLVYDPDPCDPEAIRSIAKEINPVVPFELFSSQYNMGSLDDEEDDG